VSTSNARPYHHGDLSAALIAAATALLDEGGAGAVSLREAARRLGVSPAASYRHFADKETLLAAVATEGFKELGAMMAAASKDESAPLPAMGMTYVRFALARRGLFRLMYGPELTDREKYPELKSAADEAFGPLQREIGGGSGADRAALVNAVAAWALVHGLAMLFLNGVLPEALAESLTYAITSRPIKPSGSSER
jgi:AcrR family transcriptional regulator